MKAGTKNFLQAFIRYHISTTHLSESQWRTTSGTQTGFTTIASQKALGRASKNAVEDALANGWIVANQMGTIVFTTAGQMALAAAVANPGPFDDDYRPYGTTNQRGSPTQWRGAFEDAQDLSQPEATSILGGRSPYAVLGVGRTINFADMQSAARKLLNKLHPDKATGDEARFRLVYAAYCILKDRLENKPSEVEPEAEEKPTPILAITETPTPKPAPVSVMDDGLLFDED